MGQQPRADIMNPAGTSAKAGARASGYHQKAMAEIHNSLLPFAKSGVAGGCEPVGSSAASTISTLSTTSGVSSASGLSSGSNGLSSLAQLGAAAAYAVEDTALRALQLTGGRVDQAIDLLVKQSPQEIKSSCMAAAAAAYGAAAAPKLMRKPSLERELSLQQRGSPALDSGAGSSRSDSPRTSELLVGVAGHGAPPAGRQYSPSLEFGAEPPPPPPPPRCSSTPPPPPLHVQYQPVPSNVQQLFKRMSPAPMLPSRPSPVQGAPAAQRGTSPVSSSSPVAPPPSGRQPMVNIHLYIHHYPSRNSLFHPSTLSGAWSILSTSCCSLPATSILLYLYLSC